MQERSCSDFVPFTCKVLCRTRRCRYFNPRKGGRCCVCVGPNGDPTRGLCHWHKHALDNEICNMPAIVAPYDTIHINTLASLGRTKLTPMAFASATTGTAFVEAHWKRRALKNFFNGLDLNAWRDRRDGFQSIIDFTHDFIHHRDVDEWRDAVQAVRIARPTRSNNFGFAYPADGVMQGHKGANRFISVSLLKGLQSLGNDVQSDGHRYAFEDLEVSCSTGARAGVYPKLQPYQLTAKFLLSPEMEPLISYMLFAHGVGSGKTLTMITVFDSFYYDTRPKIAVFPNAEVRDNFYGELCRWRSKYRDWLLDFFDEDVLTRCTRNDKDAIAAVKKALEIPQFRLSNAKTKRGLVMHAPFRAMSYQEVSDALVMKRGEKWSEGQMQTQFAFNEKIVMMDEAHNMLDEQLNIRKNNDAHFAHAAARVRRVREQLLKDKRSKSVIGFFTATPMIESPSQLAAMLRIVKGPVEPDRPTHEGYVSYFIARPDTIFPGHDPSGYVPKIIPVEVTGKCLSESLVKIGKAIDVQVEDGAFSVSVIDHDDDVVRKVLRDEKERTKVINFMTCAPERMTRNSLLSFLKQAVSDTKQSDELEGRLRDEAPKLWRMATDCFEDENAGLKTLIIMDEHGIKTLTLIIRYLALTRDMRNVPHEEHIDFETTYKSQKQNRRVIFRSKLAHLILTGTEVNATELTKQKQKTMPQFEDEDVYPAVILQVFENRKNFKGEHLQVLVVNAKFFSEGVSFNHVRRIVLGSVPQSYSNMIQRVARASRACQHEKFSNADRFLKVDMYVNVITAESIVNYLTALECTTRQVPDINPKTGKIKCKSSAAVKPLTKGEWVKTHGVNTASSIEYDAEKHHTKTAFRKVVAATKKADTASNKQGFAEYKKSLTPHIRDASDYQTVSVHANVKGAVEQLVQRIKDNQEVDDVMNHQVVLTPEAHLLMNTLLKQKQYEMGMCALFKAACDSNILLRFTGDPGKKCEDFQLNMQQEFAQMMATLGELSGLSATSYDDELIDFPYRRIIDNAPVRRDDYDTPESLDDITRLKLHYENELMFKWLGYLELMNPNIKVIYPSEPATDAGVMTREAVSKRNDVIIYSCMNNALWNNAAITKDLIDGFRTKQVVLVIPLLLLTRNGPHSNGLFLDLHENTMTHFEPHGGQTNVYDMRLLSTKLRRFAESLGLRLYETQQMCPRVGLQNLFGKSVYYESRQKANGQLEKYSRTGICMLFTLLFLHVKALNLDRSNESVHKYLEHHPDELEKFCYGYFHYIVDEMESYQITKKAIAIGDRIEYSYEYAERDGNSTPARRKLHNDFETPPLPDDSSESEDEEVDLDALHIEDVDVPVAHDDLWHTAIMLMRRDPVARKLAHKFEVAHDQYLELGGQCDALLESLKHQGIYNSNAMTVDELVRGHPDNLDVTRLTDARARRSRAYTVQAEKQALLNKRKWLLLSSIVPSICDEQPDYPDHMVLSISGAYSTRGPFRGSAAGAFKHVPGINGFPTEDIRRFPIYAAGDCGPSSMKAIAAYATEPIAPDNMRHVPLNQLKAAAGANSEIVKIYQQCLRVSSDRGRYWSADELLMSAESLIPSYNVGVISQRGRSLAMTKVVFDPSHEWWAFIYQTIAPEHFDVIVQRVSDQRSWRSEVQVTASFHISDPLTLRILASTNAKDLLSDTKIQVTANLLREETDIIKHTIRSWFP
ncbi:hypothetical protein JKP88DRAFT_240932 [Tribonema minus]|uniref:Helicase ATP-binding domain-containing protein n=1 Tax=Tribonema minus TaxID=303371 RepID=A0A835Z3H5_9STRA|nr:hypothetical protein JKP88DRAFT_240932 [Tribonema minus]